MKVYVFPGQGAQRKGMGEDLFNAVEEYREIEHQVDDILGYSLRKICLENPENSLSQTQYCQPCLYVVNALYWYKMMAESTLPDIIAGHSLGEYNALLAAGAFDFLTGLRLVKKRGELMSQEKGGAMAAIVGLDVDNIRKCLEQETLHGIDFANFNSPMQTVISGSSEEINQAIVALEMAGAEMCIPLWVSASFHSRYMKKTAAFFEEFLGQFEFKKLTLPVISNVTAMPYPTDLATLPSLLVRQISEPVQWTNSIRHMMALGAEEYIELGPATVLSPLIVDIRNSVKHNSSHISLNL